MQVKIEGSNLVITVPMGTPKPSTSGKTLIIATTGGNKVTDLEFNGKKMVIGVNAYVPVK